MRRATILVLAALAGCVSNRVERAAPAPAPPPARVAEPSGPGYTVRPGDTLSAIAARLGVEMTALARVNRLPPPYLIHVGQRLAIPERARYASRPAPPPRAAMPPPSPPQAAAPPRQPAFASAGPRLAWPADGPLARRFGEGLGADARGIAIAAHAGAAVRAAAPGVVSFAGAEPARYGQVVLVDHGAGWVSAYGHLGRLTVEPGERVGAGGRLGFVGSGPPGEAARLHFELRRDNRPVDPVPLLPPPW